MANIDTLTTNIETALDAFPSPEAIVEERFRQAFATMPDYAVTNTIDYVAARLQKVTQDLIKFGKTAIYDVELESYCKFDYDDDSFDMPPAELIAFRRGALRDLIASELKQHGYVVTRKKSDGHASRIVISFV